MSSDDQTDFGKNFLARLEQIEREAGLPAGFYYGLTSERDDWSYVIKLHALCETTLTQSLLKVIDKSEIDEPVAKLHMRTKITLAKGLGLLSDDSKRYLDALGLLRNRLAHDVRQVAHFSLDVFAASPPPDARLPHLFCPHLETYKSEPTFTAKPYGAALWFQTLRMWLDMDILHLRHRIASDAQQALQRLLRSDEQ